MADTAVVAEGLSIPLVDFSLFLSGDAARRESSAKSLLRGLQTAGFVYLSNCPIPPETLARVFELSAAFFAQPAEAKMARAWSTPQSNRGYSAPGREKVTRLGTFEEVEELRKAIPDLKESYEIGRDDQPEYPNRWPDTSAIPDFKPVLTSFFDACKGLHVEIMRAIAVGMTLPPDYFDPFTDAGDNTVRLLHYPAVSPALFRAKPDAVRAGAHSDYGSVTLLFQDSRGGLQVRSPTGAFVDARPVDGTVVVNAGDLLARWSNDTIKSTVHRVVEPPVAEGEDPTEHPPRYSIAYFCNPNFDRTIDVIPGTYAREEEKKYGPVNSGDYLVQRLTATY